MGDVLANSIVGALAACLAAWASGSEWPMIVAMVAGMILGMFVGLVASLTVFGPLFGAMEVMVPCMLTGMIAGMIGAMWPLAITAAARWGIVIGLSVVIYIDVLNALLQGPQTGDR